MNSELKLCCVSLVSGEEVFFTIWKKNIWLASKFRLLGDTWGKLLQTFKMQWGEYKRKESLEFNFLIHKSGLLCSNGNFVYFKNELYEESVICINKTISNDETPIDTHYKCVDSFWWSFIWMIRPRIRLIESWSFE